APETSRISGGFGAFALPPSEPAFHATKKSVPFVATLGRKPFPIAIGDASIGSPFALNRYPMIPRPQNTRSVVVDVDAATGPNPRVRVTGSPSEPSRPTRLAMTCSSPVSFGCSHATTYAEPVKATAGA